MNYRLYSSQKKKKKKIKKKKKKQNYKLYSAEVRINSVQTKKKG